MKKNFICSPFRPYHYTLLAALELTWKCGVPCMGTPDLYMLVLEGLCASFALDAHISLENCTLAETQRLPKTFGL
jgi:hypothetical protein